MNDLLLRVALFSPHNGFNQTYVDPQTKTKDKNVRLSERMREITAGRDSFSSVNVDLGMIVCHMRKTSLSCKELKCYRPN